MNDHISDLRWDRLLADELPADQRTSALAHADGCASCGARYRELLAGQGAFKLRPVQIPFAPRRSRWWWSAPIGALAAAAVLVLVVTRKPAEGERTKGADKPALLLSAGRPGALVPMMGNDAIHPGDSLQAGYTAKTDGFGAVIALDGANQVLTYVPASGDAMVALPAGTDRSFPSSTLLDDVLGKETIAIVWCEVAQPLAPFVAELRSTNTLADRDGCTIRIVVLDKAAR
ncbi:MAG: hypothetical protein H0V17_20890 [Deltaproteobacteria bacterium]|nr:hypothetical protein [Deltaproteobacteria bacterium]